MTNWPAPKHTDVHELARREAEYDNQYNLYQEWKVEPRASGYGDGAVDSTWCDVFNESGVPIVSGVRGLWAQHIVYVHNEWFALHKEDPPPA